MNFPHHSQEHATTREERMPEDLQTVLETIKQELPIVLGDALLGVYVYGSLSYGDFEPERSDVDIFVVLNRAVTPGELKRLEECFNGESMKTSRWRERLEMDYVQKKDITTEMRNTIQTIRFAGGMLRTNQQFDGASMEFKNIRDCGIVLYGPDPKEYISEIDPQLLREALEEKFESAKRGIATWGEKDLWNQMYFTIQLCRVAYSVLNGMKPISKRDAARWCGEHLPDAFHPMIAEALKAIDDSSKPRSPVLAEGIPQLIQYVESLLVQRTEKKI